MTKTLHTFKKKITCKPKCIYTNRNFIDRIRQSNE